jgi:outer membrane protein
MKQIVLILSLACSFAACAQSSIPMAPVPKAPSALAQASQLEPDGQATPITRGDAERMALRNNPRVTASQLLALAAGQVTRETLSNELPQINGNMTAVKAEDGGRIGSGELNSSRLYTHAGTGATVSQLLTDFGHTRNLVANSRLMAKAQQQNALATEQDVLIATDQAFYRLLDAQSLLDVATATVRARADVQNLTLALTKNALKSNLDLNISSADLSQAQLLQLDAENSVASARAALAELLAAPPDTQYRAIEDGSTAPPLPPDDSSALIKEAQAQRPDLQALRLDTLADQKFARAQELQHLPSISALAMGGITPVRPDGGIFTPNWYGAAGVNLTLPLFTGFRINAQAREARLRERASEKQSQELSDVVARDVRVATLSAETAFRRIGVTEAFQTRRRRL